MATYYQNISRKLIKSALVSTCVFMYLVFNFINFIHSVWLFYTLDLIDKGGILTVKSIHEAEWKKKVKLSPVAKKLIHSN